LGKRHPNAGSGWHPNCSYRPLGATLRALICERLTKT
jgi:hypothetical protein